MPKKSIEQVLQEHTDYLMRLPGVVGVGQGEHKGKPCIQIYVIHLSTELKHQLPRTLAGYPVRVQVTGEIRALSR
ncbi:MAG: hypothetical protein D6681_08150 [Calditrichaeota bacterium]|nr:MAG: hypothetical protein D6681_08150 [Calditrichota bacterium]